MAGLLRSEIRASHVPGDRLPSTEELSRRLGASVNTVHAAMAVLAKEGLVAPRHGSGVYVLPRAAETWVGILTEMDVLHPRVSGFSVQLLRALRRCFHARQIRTRLYIGEIEPGQVSPGLTSREFMDDLTANRLDGVVTTDTLPDPGWMSAAAQLGVPVAGSRLYPCGVAMDILDMIPEGVRRLREQGCCRIAMLAWNRGPAVERFRSSLEAAGLSFREGWVRRDVHPLLSGAGWEEIREIWSAYLEKPDGLLFCDDRLFKDAVPAILSFGVRVPEELRIVSHANRGSGLRAPFPVTWAEIDPDEYARALMEQVLTLVRREPPAQSHIHVSYRWFDERGGREAEAPGDLPLRQDADAQEGAASQALTGVGALATEFRSQTNSNDTGGVS